jgi:TrmH family RNA methyltransferase
MLSKNKIKMIQSLNRKKNRDEMGVFLVEGNKMVEEAIRSDFKVELLVCTPDFAFRQPEITQRAKEIIETDSESIAKASLLQNPQDALAIICQPKNISQEINLKNHLCLALDFIQDPGNLGTILRIADWYGIDHVICSENTVDVFNPKVVQASMGSIFRTHVIITELSGFIQNATENEIPVYGTFLEGKNIYLETLSSNGIIVIGNEGNGISETIGRLVTQKISIPCFSTNVNKPESLNVATAAAICCSEFRRKCF